MKAVRRSLGTNLVSALGPWFLRRLSSTWKVEIEGLEHFAAARAGQTGLLVALWHGHLLPAMAEHRNRGFWALVSQSEDGELIAKILKRFGYHVIHGSSSRGGAGALRPMLATLEQGSMLVITPDGPRGPRHSLTNSLAWMASMSGFAILPIGVGVDRAWRLKSWDRFTVPKFGARVGLVWGAPIRVAPDAAAARIEAATEEVRQALFAAERRAFELVGGTPDW